MRPIRPRSPERERGSRHLEALLDAANLPRRYHGARAESIRDPALSTRFPQLLEDPKPWLGSGLGFFFHGLLNTGKSSIAAMLLIEAVQRCESALWLPARDIAGTRFRETDRAKALDDKLQTCDLLVLDDIGAERFKLSSGAGPTLEEVARIQYDRRRTLIITSNLTWDAFCTGDYLREAEPFVSVVKRVTTPIPVTVQWPEGPSV